MPGYRRAYKTAKKLYPLMLMAYRRWDSLTDEEKQRYLEQAKQYSRRTTTYARQAAARVPRRKKPR
jgi:TRAP-type C4-dicarboxylate transport system substrate-binding protein